MLKRDPRDPRGRERLAASTLASLLLHALLAMLLVSLATSSSEQGAVESIQGGELVTIEQREPVVARVPATVHQAAPLPNVPHIARVVRYAPLVQAAQRPQPPQHHELSNIVPSAPPNPTPVPQASNQPNPQPTTAIYEPRPENELPAVPTAVPAPQQEIAVRIPPTHAPSPAPTAAPSATPLPRTPAPSAPPTAKPATPAPTAAPTARPTVAPTAVAVASPSAKPSSAPTIAPAKVAGVPSPGHAPTPGPKGLSSPGPRAGTGTANVARAAPIEVRTTPKPSQGGSGSKLNAGGGIHNDLGSLLAGMIPHNAVNPNTSSARYKVSLNGKLEPTPPPGVLAKTKFIYDERGAGNDAEIKMWVTGTHREGPLLICDGWLVRYPRDEQPAYKQGTMSHGAAWSIGVQTGGAAEGRLPPIIEEDAHLSCTERSLVPYSGSAASSP